MSADSGLPTYRGVGGLYDGQSTDDGIAIEDALSIGVFRNRPELSWKYLWQIADACRGAKPNPAHQSIAKLETEKDNIVVMTQNVDGLHRKAGTRNLIEVHGNAQQLLCTACSFRTTEADLLSILGDNANQPLPPRCPNCDSPLRPDVVLFGEMLSENTQRQLLEMTISKFDLVFSIGTSSLFPYITEPIRRAKMIGVPTIEINPGSTEISQIVDYHFKSGAAETMVKLV
ncbi:MAG: Sir2 family NAD-dependent protein deacetylase [Verrucomicrobiota bacterium]